MTVLSSIPKFKTAKTENASKCEACTEQMMHPVQECDHSERGDYQNNNGTKLSQVHMATLPHLQNVKTGVSTPLLGGLC